MNALVCELCGSHDVIKQDGYFVCQQCGTKYTVEEAKKIIGADKSDETVKIDRSSETEKLLVLARRAREILGKNAGIAQQFLFHAARMGEIS